ncbi:MAG: hypothetical protein RH948_15665 [Cyclobacteriaceae bacterium]
MLIKEKSLQHWIENFYGYGSWQAKYWFVAYEEGGGDLPQEVADKLNHFEKVHPVDNPTLCDIRALYKKVDFHLNGPRANLFTNLYDYRFGNDAVLHGTWKNLIAFVHGHQHKVLPDLLTYQQNSLASVTSESEALIRLYPLPAHNHAWYYSWLDMPGMPYLKSRTEYQEHVYPNRIEKILNNITVHQPKVVLLYGMNNIDKLKKSVKTIYPGTQFKMIKAIPQQIPQLHRADLPNTTLLITTQRAALRHNRIETGFDWEEVGKLVGGY